MKATQILKTNKQRTETKTKKKQRKKKRRKKETDRQRQSQTDRETETERDRERQSDRQRQIQKQQFVGLWKPPNNPARITSVFARDFKLLMLDTTRNNNNAGLYTC